MLRPPRLLGGKSPKPRFLSRKQQANLGLQVVAFFILVALVLVAVVLIPHGGRALIGSGGSSSGSAPVLEKRTAPAPVSPKGAAAPGGSSTTAMPAAKGNGHATAAAEAGAGAGAAAEGRAEAQTTKKKQEQQQQQQQPSPPHQEEPPAELLFGAGTVLVDREGKAVKDPTEALRGRAVGLLFGGMWCPMCQSFFPRIKEFLREAGRHGDIAIVYVSSDTDEAAASKAQSEHGWDFAVPFDDAALRSKLKNRYRVWAMMESGEFGQDRKSGIPTIVAVDERGHVLQHMDVGVEDMGVLGKWRYKEWAW